MRSDTRAMHAAENTRIDMLFSSGNEEQAEGAPILQRQGFFEGQPNQWDSYSTSIFKAFLGMECYLRDDS
jgi:hypothetical protein